MKDIHDNNGEYTLGPIKEEDIPYFLLWFNDRSLCKHMDDSEKDKKYCSDDILSMIKDVSSIYMAFRCDNKIIGFASIYDISRPNMVGEFSFMIGDPCSHGKGLGKRLLSLIIQKAKEMDLTALTCSVYAENFASIKCIESANFQKMHKKNVKNGRVEYFYIKHFRSSI
ncbi:MAG: GNAT family N-acetyltransferase [bacterium]